MINGYMFIACIFFIGLAAAHCRGWFDIFIAGIDNAVKRKEYTDLYISLILPMVLLIATILWPISIGIATYIYFKENKQ